MTREEELIVGVAARKSSFGVVLGMQVYYKIREKEATKKCTYKQTLLLDLPVVLRSLAAASSLHLFPVPDFEEHYFIAIEAATAAAAAMKTKVSASQSDYFSTSFIHFSSPQLLSKPWLN